MTKTTLVHQSEHTLRRTALFGLAKTVIFAALIIRFWGQPGPAAVCVVGALMELSDTVLALVDYFEARRIPVGER